MGSCAKDDTTLGGNPISEITIDEGSIQPQYNVSKNETLVINPIISQTLPGKELSYEWEVEHEIVSKEAQFHYNCLELGSFDCRLIVSNEDGKAFASFTINVNTPYEEGLVIISKNPDGESMVSFMLHDTEKNEDLFYPYDIFSLNNPEISLAPNVSDAVLSNGSLILACRGKETIPPSIYYLHEKTMELENYVSVPEYAGFSPRQLIVCSVAFPGASYPVLSENGKVYDFASTEGTVVESSKFTSIYDIETSVFFDNGSGTNYNIFFWDTIDNVLVTMFNGYGGYYCIQSYEQRTDRANINPISNIFAPGNDKPVAMFIPRFKNTELLRDTPLLYVISESNGRLRRTAINKAVWTYNSEDGKNHFDLRESFSDVGEFSGSPLEKGAPMIASNTNKSLFFSKGNVIYQWHYPQGNINSASVFATVGESSSIVTSMDLSSDQTLLYVASYDPSKGGKNGSCHIIPINKTASTEEIYSGEITNFNEISYQPVKILYKKK